MNSLPITSSSSLPRWLREHCERLSEPPTEDTAASTIVLDNLNLNIRRFGTMEMVQALAEAMHGNRRLRVLNMTSSLSLLKLRHPLPAQDDGVVLTPFASSTNTNTNDETSIGSSGALCYCSLEVLHLSYNRLSSADVTCLKYALCEDASSLTELYLDHNAIGDVGAIAIAQGLQQNNTHLRKLRLDSNHIGDDGAQALATSLTTNRDLQVLGLQRNQIMMPGALALLHALESSHPPNFTIRSLLLQENTLSPEEEKQVLPRIQYLGMANEAGRCLFATTDLNENKSPLSDAIMPLVLARVAHCNDPTMLYYLVSSQPELMGHHRLDRLKETV